ncbi:MAG: ATP-binding protein [Spirochaeta sp.]
MDFSNRVFIDETNEILTQLEQDVVSLEQHPEDTELINQMFRGIHTMKGSGGMFGYDNLSRQAHAMESIFDLLRSGSLPVSRQLIDLTLRGIDRLKQMLEDAGIPPDTAAWEELLNSPGRQNGSKKGTAENAPSSGADKPEQPADDSGFHYFHIYFYPDPQLMLHGSRPMLLFKELSGLGVLNITANDSSMPDFEQMDPAQCYTSFDILLAGKVSEQEIRDVFLFVEHNAELRIRRIAVDGDDEQGLPRLGEILQQRYGLNSRQMERILAEQKKYLRIGELAVSKGYVAEQDVENALQEQQFVREQSAKHREADASLRIPGGKVDNAVNLVGEMVTLQARISRRAKTLQDSQLMNAVEALELLVADLREGIMGMRLVPVNDTFIGFRRLIRDLSHETGKQLQLEIQGGETEMDKRVIDQLKGGLVHLIRNCADHGIETPAQRTAAGKPAHGTVRLSARYVGSQVQIDIADDGAGIQVEKVRQKAVERGVLQENDGLEPADVLSILTAPGFSTSEAVSSLSGRGVGMDVVKQEVEALSGQLSLESSPGKGTRFCIRLPLTLAIIDSLLVRVGQEHFTIHLSDVDEGFILRDAPQVLQARKRISNYNGKPLSYLICGNTSRFPEPRRRLRMWWLPPLPGRRLGLWLIRLWGKPRR